MNESSVPLYRIGGKPFYNKPQVGSIVRVLLYTTDYNRLGKVTKVLENEFIIFEFLHDKSIRTYDYTNQDKTWELVLE